VSSKIWSQNSTSVVLFLVDESSEISIGDVAREISKAFEFSGEIVFDTTAADGQMKKTASNNKLRRYLPDFQFTSFTEGITKTVQWFKENQNTARL